MINTKNRCCIFGRCDGCLCRTKERDSLVEQQSALIAAITDDADNPQLLEQLLAVDQQMANLVVTAEQKQLELRRQYLHQQEASACVVM